MNDASRDYRDLIAGALLVALGIASAWYAGTHYRLGEVSRMGPGMFPAALGVLMAILGFFIALPAWFRRGTLPKPDIRPTLLVLASVLAFALLVEWAGMVPAIFVLTGLAVLADNKLGVRATLVLASVLALSTWLIFRVGLGIQLQPFVWPF